MLVVMIHGANHSVNSVSTLLTYTLIEQNSLPLAAACVPRNLPRCLATLDPDTEQPMSINFTFHHISVNVFFK